AKPRPRTLRIGVAADDELLAHAALYLLPTATAHRLVGRIRALRDDALETELARLGEEIGTFAFDMVAVLNGRDLPDDLAQQLLAIRERCNTKVVAVEIQKVECVVERRGTGFVGEQVLQRLEARSAAGVVDD